ncbi:MAG TPA: EamA family transporter [Pseudonocardiaceae bacterium]|nr:EamA family transporter [Pseudonocardiaceae bacterium]
MGILLGLAAALLYGGSDFAGGLASRRLAALPVNLVGTVVTTVVVWIAVLVSGAPAPDTGAVLWGLLAGLGGGAGTLLLYRGLARGQMSVVGPVSAVASAALPALVGVALGDRPGLLATAGVLVALPAIALVAASGSGGRRVPRTALLDGLAAGAAFGLMFVALAKAGTHSGLWPVAWEASSSLLLLLVLAVITRPSLRMKVRDLTLPVVSGVSGMAATLLYFYATHFGMLATVAILTSLYPGVTVLLARLVVKEKFVTAQRIGLGLCAFAVVAIAAG